MAKIPTAQKYKQSSHVVKIKLQSFQSVSEIYSNELIILFLNGMLNYVQVLMKELKAPLSLPRSSFPHKVESKAWLSTQTSKRQRTCNLLYSRHWVSHIFLISHVFLLLIVFLQWGPKPKSLANTKCYPALLSSTCRRHSWKRILYEESDTMWDLGILVF